MCTIEILSVLSHRTMQVTVLTVGLNAQKYFNPGNFLSLKYATVCGTLDKILLVSLTYMCQESDIC